MIVIYVTLLINILNYYILHVIKCHLRCDAKVNENCHIDTFVVIEWMKCINRVEI